MKDEISVKTEAAEEPKAFGFLQAAIPFVVTLFFGTLITAVVGLFVYANAVDPKSRDLRFAVVELIGVGISAVLAWFAARRTIELDQAQRPGPALSLLKKYGRSATQPGVDAQAGQYSIGEHYLRELLGRRGA